MKNRNVERDARMALNEDDIAWLERIARAQLLKVLGSPGALPEVLEWALSHENWAVRQTACDNPHLSESLMLSHYKRFGWLELIILVNKKNLPREVLEYVAVIPPDIRADKKDWNKELRDIARKKLGLSKWNEESAGK